MSNAFAKIMDMMDRVYRPHGEPRRVLYHYCSADVLLSILTHKIMWASNVRYQNDPRELLYASDMVKDMVKELKQLSAPSSAVQEFLDKTSFSIFDCNYEAYTISFSEVGDLLSQWRAYGANGSGFAIGLDAIQICPRPLDSKGTLIQVQYNEEDQKNLLRSVFQEAFSFIDTSLSEVENPVDRKELMSEMVEWFPVLLAPFMVSFKAQSYQEEREWRCVVTMMPGESEDVKFRARGNMIVPYVELSLGSGERLLPLAEIVMGPTRDHRLDKWSLSTLLANTNLVGAVIRNSSLSYRT